ncbi:hypothetical protein AB4Z51_29045 [Bradyrhizobium sp. 2TAF36]|uniref:hypothetical protein n=1 Tax=Bradyrhizobium sp. 2TAF36 TaxID=3233016 RepID=UPI003F8DB0B5
MTSYSESKVGKSLTLIIVKLKRPISSIRSRAHERGIHLPGTRIGPARKLSGLQSGCFPGDQR